jgi:hypothetical protein
MAKAIPTDFSKFYSYDPTTGVISRSLILWGDQEVPCSIAVGRLKNGYQLIKFRNRTYPAHRVAWFLHYGEDPGGKEIDHINGIKTDNRIDNLRLALPIQNAANRVRKGFRKKDGKYEARIRFDGVETYLGRYDCPLMAHLAYQDAHRELCREWSPY